MILIYVGAFRSIHSTKPYFHISLSHSSIHLIHHRVCSSNCLVRLIHHRVRISGCLVRLIHHRVRTSGEPYISWSRILHIRTPHSTIRIVHPGGGRSGWRISDRVALLSELYIRRIVHQPAKDGTHQVALLGMLHHHYASCCLKFSILVESKGAMQGGLCSSCTGSS